MVQNINFELVEGKTITNKIEQALVDKAPTVLTTYMLIFI